MSETILSVKNLCTSFTTEKGEVMAVNGVSFNLDKGKILGIVGESVPERVLLHIPLCKFWKKTEVLNRVKFYLKVKILQNFQKNR